MRTVKELYDFSVRNNYNTANAETAIELFEKIAENIEKNDEAFFSCAYIDDKQVSYAYAVCFQKVVVANTQQGVGNIAFSGNEMDNRNSRETFKNNLIKQFAGQ